MPRYYVTIQYTQLTLRDNRFAQARPAILGLEVDVLMAHHAHNSPRHDLNERVLELVPKIYHLKLGSTRHKRAVENLRIHIVDEGKAGQEASDRVPTRIQLAEA